VLRIEAGRAAVGEGVEAEEQVDACFIFIGAAPRTDWLEGVVARDSGATVVAKRGGIVESVDAGVPFIGWAGCPFPVSRVRGDSRHTNPVHEVLLSSVP